MQTSGPNSADVSLNVVAIGGGTGLSTLLKGFKEFVPAPHEPGHAAASRHGGIAIGDLSAVVTVSDDGGSSGRLRKEMNILAPGDVRNCLVALSEDEGLLAQLFRYRFAAGADRSAPSLEGHSFGNLFLAALTAMTGDFAEAVRLASEILATRGRIFPATSANVQLIAEMDDDSVVRGETQITASSRRIVRVRLDSAAAEPLPQTLEAIAHADLITIGPGSLFTSLVPNLLVRGIPEGIAASHALKIFVCNLMTQANESLGLSACDHLRALERHAGRQLFDVALVNTASLTRNLTARYALEGASQIVGDIDAIEKTGVRVVSGDFVEEHENARHAAGRVAEECVRLAGAHQQRRLAARA